MPRTKKRTTQLQPGDVILVATLNGHLRPAAKITGSEPARVHGIAPTTLGISGRRTMRAYNVVTTAGTIKGATGSQTYTLATPAEIATLDAQFAAPTLL